MITVQNCNLLIRKLAKSDYWQTIYSLGEKTKIQLFSNTTDFTDLQIVMLKYLNFYSGLYMEIALGEVNEIVLDCNMYEDAYMMYKNKKDKDKNKDFELSRQPKKEKTKIIPQTKWLFKSPNKK